MFSKHSKEHGKRKLPKTPCFKEKFYLPKLQKTLPFTEYPTGEESFEKNVADVAVDKVFKLRTDRLIDRQQIPIYDMEAVAGLVPLFADQYSQSIVGSWRRH